MGSVAAPLALLNSPESGTSHRGPVVHDRVKRVHLLTRALDRRAVSRALHTEDHSRRSRGSRKAITQQLPRGQNRRSAAPDGFSAPTGSCNSNGGCAQSATCPFRSSIRAVRGGESGQSSSSMAICDTLARAGLGDEPDVRPLSVTAWAGVKMFEQTGRIDTVARRLGMRSLDRAALLIGWDWTNPAEHA